MDESGAGCVHGSQFMPGHSCVPVFRAEEANNSIVGELARTD